MNLVMCDYCGDVKESKSLDTIEMWTATFVRGEVIHTVHVCNKCFEKRFLMNPKQVGKGSFAQGFKGSCTCSCKEAAFNNPSANTITSFSELMDAMHRSYDELFKKGEDIDEQRD